MNPPLRRTLPLAVLTGLAVFASATAAPACPAKATAAHGLIARPATLLPDCSQQGIQNAQLTATQLKNAAPDRIVSVWSEPYRLSSVGAGPAVAATIDHALTRQGYVRQDDQPISKDQSLNVYFKGEQAISVIFLGSVADNRVLLLGVLKTKP